LEMCEGGEVKEESMREGRGVVFGWESELRRAVAGLEDWAEG